MALLQTKRTNSFHSHDSFVEEEIIEDDDDYTIEEVIGSDDDDDEYIEEEIIDDDEEEFEELPNQPQQQQQQKLQNPAISALHETMGYAVSTDDEEELVADDDSSSGDDFDDDSTVPNFSVSSDNKSTDAELGPSFKNDKGVDLLNKKRATIQMELVRAAESDGARKAMEEERAREKARKLAESRGSSYNSSSSQLGTIGGGGGGGLLRQTSEDFETVRQRDKDETARRKLAEEIRKVDMALAKKREIVAQTRAYGAAEVEKRKKALVELRRQAARAELTRNNTALKAAKEARYSNGGSSIKTPDAPSIASQSSAPKALPPVAANNQSSGDISRVPSVKNAAESNEESRSAAPLTRPPINGKLVSKSSRDEFAASSTQPARRLSSRNLGSDPKQKSTNGSSNTTILRPTKPKSLSNLMTDTSNSTVNKVDKRESALSALRSLRGTNHSTSTASSSTSVGGFLQATPKPPIKSSKVSLPDQQRPMQGRVGIVRQLSSSGVFGGSGGPSVGLPKRPSAAKEPEKTASMSQPPPSVDATTEVMNADTFYSVDDLREKRIPGLNYFKREIYLSPADFEVHFKMTKEEFWKQPKWKRDKAKRALRLF